MPAKILVRRFISLESFLIMIYISLMMAEVNSDCKLDRKGMALNVIVASVQEKLQTLREQKRLPKDLEGSMSISS